MTAQDPIEELLRPGAEVERRAAELAAGFAERAAEAGEAEVAYAKVDSPMGPTLVAATGAGLVSVGLPNRELEDFVAELAESISPRVVEAPGQLDAARRELSEYFDGNRSEFGLELDWRLVPGGFYRRVLRQTARVAFGEVLTYGEVARKAGNARAHRAAGTALGSNPIPIVIPCHRIVRAGGDPGSYGGGPELKRWLLRLEGALED